MLPARLRRYQGLIGLLVEQLLREAEQGAETVTPGGDEPTGRLSTTTKINRRQRTAFTDETRSADEAEIASIHQGVNRGESISELTRHTR